VFGAGDHNIFAGQNPTEGGFTAGAREMVVLPGANVLLSSTTGFAPQTYTFNQVVELQGATVRLMSSLMFEGFSEGLSSLPNWCCSNVAPRSSTTSLALSEPKVLTVAPWSSTT
jgi:hypothetical protein